MVLSSIPLNQAAPHVILDGAWDFSLGDLQQWSQINVPGAWESRGYDRRIEEPGCYRRQVIIPAEWAGSRTVLEFGAVSYFCKVAVNGIQVGEHQGMWTSFAFDITAVVHPGMANLVEVEVYKPSHLPGARFPFRASLAGFIPDVSTTFGGLWQDVTLHSFQAWFEDLRVTANYDTGEVVCSFRTGAVSTEDLNGAEIDISVSLAGQQVASCTVEGSHSGITEARCQVPHPVRWSPENPALYDVDLTLHTGERVLAAAHRRLGFRSLSASGEKLFFNDKPIMLRGILHWGWDPGSIAPFFEAEAARAEIRKVKRMGFNLVKLCLFVPNAAFYEAADEEGIFLWQEWPMWLPQVDPGYADRAPAEYEEYMRLARDHPSIVIYSAGCELDDSVEAGLLGRLNQVMRAGAAGTLFCDNSGMGEAYGGLQVDFSDFSDYHTYSDLNFFEEMLDHWRRDWKPARPLIFGEFCDSDTYRDQEEITKDSGGQLPWWLANDNPVMDWRTDAHPVLEQANRMASANLSLLPQQVKQISYAGSLAVRKFVLESIRSRAGTGGYVITGMRDTPISTSGIFDDFGNSKWEPEQFLPINGECVLCLDGERRRRWQHGGDRVDRFDLQNAWSGEQVTRHLIFSGPGISFNGKAQVAWRLVDPAGNALAEYKGEVRVDLDGTRPREIIPISLQMPDTTSPQELRLEAEFSIPAASTCNAWSIWIYPERESLSSGQAGAGSLYDPGYVLTELEGFFHLNRPGDRLSPPGDRLVVASALPPWSDDFLRSGGRMILLQWGDGPLPALRRPFWREAIRIFAPHPLWRYFGAGGDLRFLAVSSDVSLDLEPLREVLPSLDEALPIFRRLDARDFRVSEYLLEIRFGKGILVACTLRLAGGFGRQPAGLGRNIAGQALFRAMQDYLEEE